MTDNEKDIDALLRHLNGQWIVGTAKGIDEMYNGFASALTALVAERDKLVEDNASQTYKGNSVRYWHDKASAYRATIGSLWEILESAAVRPDGERTITAVLTALVAERNSLKQRVAELEAHPPAASDLRERLLESALRGVSLSGYDKRGSESLGRAAVWMVDAAIAAMRKGDSDGK